VRDVLPEGVDAERRHAVVQHTENEHREHRADDGTLAALKHAATERSSRDGLQLEALRTGRRLAGAGARGDQDTRERGDYPGQRVDADQVAVDVNPGQPSGGVVPAGNCLS